MNPAEYKTFAAYWGKDGKVIFGLTQVEFSPGKWYNPSSLGIKSLEHALAFDEQYLRTSLARALMDAVMDSGHSLMLDFEPSHSEVFTTLDAALRTVFWNPHYRTRVFASQPETIALPKKPDTLLENLNDRLEGGLRKAYVRMVKELSPKVEEPLTA